jgi:hypothetical protein
MSWGAAYYQQLHLLGPIVANRYLYCSSEMIHQLALGLCSYLLRHHCWIHPSLQYSSEKAPCFVFLVRVCLSLSSRSSRASCNPLNLWRRLLFIFEGKNRFWCWPNYFLLFTDIFSDVIFVVFYWWLGAKGLQKMPACVLGFFKILKQLTKFDVCVPATGTQCCRTTYGMPLVHDTVVWTGSLSRI